MRTSDLLHFAFRARDTQAMAHFYADLFEGDFFLHPIMTGLGIMVVKINHPAALFRGLLEFWPWDVIWDGAGGVFRRVPARPSPTSYGHLAVKVSASERDIVAELQRKGIAFRREPRAPGFDVLTIDDPEGNMIELFANVDHMQAPPDALCPRDRAVQAIAELQRRFAEVTAGKSADTGYPLL